MPHVVAWLIESRDNRHHLVWVYLHCVLPPGFFGAQLHCLTDPNVGRRVVGRTVPVGDLAVPVAIVRNAILVGIQEIDMVLFDDLILCKVQVNRVAVRCEVEYVPFLGRAQSISTT